MAKTLNEVILANLKAELQLAIMGNFIMRRAYLEAEIKKIEKESKK